MCLLLNAIQSIMYHVPRIDVWETEDATDDFEEWAMAV